MGTTKAEAPELKPCPLCGSTNLFLRDRGGWEIDCAECELNLVVSSNPSREGVIAAWNTRAADLAPAGELVSREAVMRIINTIRAGYRTESDAAEKIDNGAPNFWAARARAIDIVAEAIRALPPVARVPVVAEDQDSGSDA